MENGTLVLLEVNERPSFRTPFESEYKLYYDFFIDLYNIGSIRPVNAKTDCNKKCKQ